MKLDEYDVLSLRKITNLLVKRFDMPKLFLESKSESQLRSLIKVCSRYNNSILHESKFNSYMNNSTYSRNLLLIEAAKILLEIMPRRSKKKVKEALVPNIGTVATQPLNQKNPTMSSPNLNLTVPPGTGKEVDDPNHTEKPNSTNPTMVFMQKNGETKKFSMDQVKVQQRLGWIISGQA